VLVLGHGMLYAGPIVSAIDAPRTARECRDFLTMIEVDEKVMMDIVNNPDLPRDKQIWTLAFEAAERLKEKAKSVEEDTAKGSRLKPIASTYLHATRYWYLAFAEARHKGRLTSKSRAEIEYADELREQALTE